MQAARELKESGDGREVIRLIHMVVRSEPKKAKVKESWVGGSSLVYSDVAATTGNSNTTSLPVRRR